MTCGLRSKAAGVKSCRSRDMDAIIQKKIARNSTDPQDLRKRRDKPDGREFEGGVRSLWNHKLHVAPFSLDLPSNGQRASQAAQKDRPARPQPMEAPEA